MPLSNGLDVMTGALFLMETLRLAGKSRLRGPTVLRMSLVVAPFLGLPPPTPRKPTMMIGIPVFLQFLTMMIRIPMNLYGF